MKKKQSIYPLFEFSQINQEIMVPAVDDAAWASDTWENDKKISDNLSR